jgi:ParB family chromosome partitioning protein
MDSIRIAPPLIREASSRIFSPFFHLLAKLGCSPNQLATQGGVHEIAINLIDPDPVQPRQTFPQLVIQERAESLRRQGQKNPIVLIPQLDGRYKLFDGELRWRSAPLAGMRKLKAVFLPKEEAPDEVVVFEGQIVSSIHSEKLHDLDLAAALIRVC